MEKNGGGECGQPGYLGFVNGTIGPSSIVVVGIRARFSMLAMTPPPPRPYLVVGTHGLSLIVVVGTFGCS